MKRIFAILLCFVLVLSLAACGKQVAPDVEDNEQTVAPDEEPTSQPSVPEQTEPEPKPEPEPQPEPEPEPQPEPQPTELNFEQFLEKAAGVWLFTETISDMGMEYSYEFCSISKEYFGGGVYPGGGSRPGQIREYAQAEENVFKLSLYYAAGDFMGEELPEERATLTVTLLEDGSAKIQYENNKEMHAIFGGAELEDAQKAAADYMAKK